VNGRQVLLLTIFTLAGLLAFPGRPLAAEPRKSSPEIPFADPQKMFDRILGEESEEDKKALAAIEISMQDERQMGETVVAGFLASLRQRKIAVASSGKEVEYLRDLVETIRPRMEHSSRYKTIRVYLAQSPQCDARSFPGGTLIFFRGLLETARSEAAVIGIVGHELSHLDRGHLLHRARRIELAQQEAAKRPVGSPERFTDAAGTLAQIWTHPFHPEDEAEADRDGARWEYRAGYDPREMAKLFLTLGERQSSFENNMQLFMPAFLRSHPDSKSRYQAIMKFYDELEEANPNDRLYVGKENLRRRIARSHRKFAE
jgi:predicted Zn-dependent protease